MNTLELLPPIQHWNSVRVVVDVSKIVKQNLNMINKIFESSEEHTIYEIYFIGQVVQIITICISREAKMAKVDLIGKT